MPKSAKNNTETEALSKKEYEKELEKYQLRLTFLQREVRNRNLAVILAFEGWDASGKGGAIKRITATLDPRGIKVYPIGAPTLEELSHHYLWRFWTKTPAKGQIVIFDRTWYGRVLVERVEGFAKETEWKRAYKEINEFERSLTDNGAIIIKYFLSITADEQLNRFKERESDPVKSWKMTAEDWRNREKWGDYEIAIAEMIEKTSTKKSPWHSIDSNSKRHARIEVLKTLTKTLEEACNVNPKLLYPASTK